MLEPNLCVFRASAAWKHPCVEERLKKDTDSWTGLFTSTGTLTNSVSISGLHKKVSIHIADTHLLQTALLFQPSLRAISTLCQGAWTVNCQLWVSFRGLGVCSYQSPTADLPWPEKRLARKQLYHRLRNTYSLQLTLVERYDEDEERYDRSVYWVQNFIS